MRRITVLLADDHRVVREGLRALLECTRDIAVVGEAANGLEAVEMACALRPQVVVLDITMPKLNGLEAARRILQEVTPAPKVLMLSALADEAYVEQAVAVGAAGYLLKQSGIDLLARAIRAIHHGETFFSPSIAPRLACQALGAPRQASNSRTTVVLTTRERDVLHLVSAVLKEISADWETSSHVFLTLTPDTDPASQSPTILQKRRCSA